MGRVFRRRLHIAAACATRLHSFSRFEYKKITSGPSCLVGVESGGWLFYTESGEQRDLPGSSPGEGQWLTRGTD